MTRRCQASRALLAALASLLVRPAFAQLPLSEPPKLPTNPDQWLNSSPLTYEGLRGKAVVFWYFEETCPRCAAKWPGLEKFAAHYKDRPVLFIGVNSGADARQISGYGKQHKIDWPIIVDSDRSFEQASGVQEISLQRIWDVRVVKPDGQFTSGRWDDLPGTVDGVLKDAAWKVKYDRLHPSMHAAVRRMEFGDFRPVALAIKNGMKDKSPDVQRAAGQVRGFIDRQIQEAIDKAIDDVPKDDAWLLFTAHQQVAERFAPHELPKAVAAELDRLRRDPTVKKEVLAAKAVDANAPDLSSPDEQIRKRAVSRLERVLKSYPGTHGADRAKLLMDKGTSGDSPT